MPKGSRFVVLAVSLVALLTYSQLVSSLPQGNLKQTKDGARHFDKPVSFDSAEADRTPCGPPGFSSRQSLE